MSSTGAAAVIAVGSNLGDRESTIRAAICEIDGLRGVSVAAASGLVESNALKPAGVDKAAPNYLNAVVLVLTTLTPHELLDALNAIEDRHGRLRERRWGDRTIDLDLIAVDGAEESSERLTLPHPQAWQRAFVLAPWLQVDSDAAIPGRGRVDDLLAATGDEVWEFVAEPLYPALAPGVTI